MEEVFEKASRVKLRFLTPKGVWTVEDLWDASLSVLDLLYKGLNKELKAAGEESLLATKTKGDAELSMRVDIIKHIVVKKLAEAAAFKDYQERKAKKARLMELILEKQDASLSAKSIEELQAEIDKLG
jgi:hypothetical protein